MWAALLLISAGLGPFSGTLALALHTTGVLGRMFAEALENTPKDNEFALSVRGISRNQNFLFCTNPANRAATCELHPLSLGEQHTRCNGIRHRRRGWTRPNAVVLPQLV